MATKRNMQDILSAALGVVSGVLAVIAILGVLRPGEHDFTLAIGTTAIVALIVGVVGLNVGLNKGHGRQLAVGGTVLSVAAVLMYFGMWAYHALVAAS